MDVRFKFDVERASAAMALICELNPPKLDVYRMCKLIFLADKLHLVRYARPITGDRICAMEHGPVPSEIYRILKHLQDGAEAPEELGPAPQIFSFDKSFSYPRITASGGRDLIEDVLSESDREVISEVVANHGEKAFDELKGLTHEMPAYKKAWGGKVHNSPTMLFEDLFEEDEDALAGVKEEMIEDFRLRAAFPNAL